MNMRAMVWDCLATFSLAVVVGAIVTFLWSLIAHGSAMIDWETSVTLGFVMSAVQASRSWQERKGR